MSTITQTLTLITAPIIATSVDALSPAAILAYVESQQTYDSSIVNTLIPQMNTIIGQTNIVIGELNTLASGVSTNAGIATTKAQLSADYAEKMTLAVETGTYSSKEHAIGDLTATGGSAKAWALDASAPDGVATSGSSKTWATKVTTTVDGTLYSAKEYASGDATASGGSAKAWATDTASPDGTTSKSAKTLAAEAAASVVLTNADVVLTHADVVTCTNLAGAFVSTSTTSVLIGTGSKSFTTQIGEQYSVGAFISIAYTTTPTNFMHGQVTSYNSGTGALVVDVQSVGGSGTYALWSISLSGARGAIGATGTSTISPLVIDNKTAAYTVVAGDLGKVINCTSGTFTVSLTAAATLGAGFYCTIENSSNTATDAITINPSASETIDGITTLILRRGEGLNIISDGTNWYIDNKKPMRGYAENYIVSEERPIASGSNSIAIGTWSTASNTSAMAIGRSTTASGITSAAFGESATASGSYSMALGSGTAAGISFSSAIGMCSSGVGAVTATGAGAMALGGSYASGADSLAAAIGNNTSTYGATGANSVSIGYLAKAGGANSISIGKSLVSSAIGSITIGTEGTASGVGSVTLGGTNTLGLLASGTSSFAIGEGSKASEYGKYAYSAKATSTLGDTQSGKIVLRATTTTTTAVVLTSDGTAASTTNQLIITSGQAMAIQGTLIAKVSASGAIAGWNITGIVSNNAGTMAVSGLALTAIGTDSITLGLAPTITVDNTNKGVTITSGYKSATNIRWVATVNTSEVTYA